MHHRHCLAQVLAVSATTPKYCQHTDRWGNDLDDGPGQLNDHFLHPASTVQANSDLGQSTEEISHLKPQAIHCQKR